jgi:hypothetical protein
MIKIIHSYKRTKIEKNVDDDGSFMLTNKIGGYCYLSSKPISRYQGVFFNDNFKIYKIIDNINLVNKVGITEIRNNFFDVERKRKNIIERFFMPYNYNTLVYELDKENEIEVILDVRESYKSPEFGRFYDIFKENNKIIIKYTQENEFECYLVINNVVEWKKTGRWFKQYYELDKKRNSFPYEKYVFSALKVKTKKLIFSFSFNKEKAIKENDFILGNIEKLKIEQKKRVMNLINTSLKTTQKIKNKEIRIAYICALNSLYNLVVRINNIDGIYAGLPWFFQFWIRDELISLKALMLMREFSIVKELLYKQIRSIENNGEFLNKYQEGDEVAADTIGLLFKRINDFKGKLPKKKLGIIKQKLNEFVDILVKKYTIDSFAINNSKATWMDSLERKGIRIEIQALRLSIYRIMYNLTKHKVYKYLEMRLRKRVREELWNGKILVDGVGDYTIRPNLFIASYVYPQLLTKREWITCFYNVLPKLWCKWGGIATIDKNTPLFCLEYSGENPKSYHNGDSWFWLNNLTALILYRIDKNKFRGYIKKILSASTKEILWRGAIGNHAELSSALQLESQGCLNQAWSSAMYIELISEIFH